MSAQRLCARERGEGETQSASRACVSPSTALSRAQTFNAYISVTVRNRKKFQTNVFIRI